MRVIRFRGKSKKTGEWLYGDLVRNVEGAFAVVPPFEMTTSNYCDRYEVESESVGQFTGYVDENGADIYEGDIVEGRFSINPAEKANPYRPKKLTYRVRVDLGQFYLDPGFVGIPSELVREIEIIGDIYDNPELWRK